MESAPIIPAVPTALPVAENVTAETTSPPVFEWKLKKTEWTKSIFNKLKMKEYVNIHQIYGFIKADMGITYQGNPRYDGIPCEIKTELDQIKALRNLYDVKQEHISMAHVLPVHKWGRTIPVGYASLSVLHRPTRHALSAEKYVDYDIENCQPQLINEICRQHGIENKQLTRYNSKPKYYRQAIAEFHGTDKDTAKQLFVRLMFGGTYDTWLKDHDISQNADKRHALPHGIEKEMGAVIDAVYTHNPSIVKDVLRSNPNKWKNEGEKKRGVMGLWSQTIERRIMEDSVSYLHEKHGLTVEQIVPCQDGLMVLKDLAQEGFCAELQANIKRLYGFDMKFVVKPFDEAIEIPLFEDVMDYQQWVDAISAKRLADRLADKYGDFIVSNDDGLFVFYDGRWYNETDEKHRHRLTRYVSENLYNDLKNLMDDAVELTAKECDQLSNSLRTATSNGGTFKDIVRHTLSVRNGASPHVKFDADPYLLGFENGLYELTTGTFRPYQFNDYVTLTTGYNYTPDADPAMREKIEAFFQEIQPDPTHLNLLYQVLASALDGINYQKFWFYNGKGGNGKGVVSKLMRSVLGENFCYSPKEELLKEVGRSNGASPDIADLQFKRYIIFTEMGGTIKLTSFRRLTGGDHFTGRQLYGNNQHFYLNATLGGEFNNPPDFDAKAMEADYRRAVDFKFGTNFTEDPDKIDKEINGVFYKQANPYYISEQFITEATPTFLQMLLEKYREFYDPTIKAIKYTIPEDIRRESKKLVDSTNVFQQIAEELYEEAPPECEMKAKDIWQDIQYHERHKTLSKAAKRQYSQKELYEWLQGRYTTRQTGDRPLVVTGLKRRGGNEEDEGDYEG